MQRIRRVDPFSVGKVAFVCYGLIGLLIGGLFTIAALLGAAGAALGGGDGSGVASVIGLMMGAGAVIILPLFYGVIGALTTMLLALLYNLVARLTGGIAVELE